MGAGRQYGLLFILPAIIVLALLIVYPIAYTGLLSVTDDQGNYVGAANYAAVVSARVDQLLCVEAAVSSQSLKRIVLYFAMRARKVGWKICVA